MKIECVMVKGEKAGDFRLDLYMNDKRIQPKRSQKGWNHSPDGFSAGYSGSGPVQLALAILLELVPKELAVRWHQDFKFHFLAKPELQQKDFILDWQAVEQWLINQEGSNSR